MNYKGTESGEQENNASAGGNSNAKWPFIPAWLDDSNLSNLAFRIYCSIVRRETFWESKTNLEKRLNASNRSISNAFKELISAGLIVEIERTGSSSLYIPSAKQHHPTNSTTPPCKTASPPSAEKHPKGNPKKVPQRRKSNSSASQHGLEFADWFHSLLPPEIDLKDDWREIFAKAHDDLVRIDNRSPSEIRQVCQWGREDHFWKGNFMSPTKLRKRNGDGITYWDIFHQKINSSKKQPTTPLPRNQDRKGIEEEIPS